MKRQAVGIGRSVKHLPLGREATQLWMAPQLLEGDRFDLPNPFARDAEDFSRLLERVGPSIADAEAHADDLFFTRREASE
jgi:hypothetical protein